MKYLIRSIAPIIATGLLAACSQKKVNYSSADTVSNTGGQQVRLAAPYATKSAVSFCKVIGWPKGKMPVAPAGFKVSLYADSLDNPRNIYVAPNGDVFAAEATTEAKGTNKVKSKIDGQGKSQNMGESPNKIIIFRDVNGDGIPERRGVFLSGLNKPYGMLIVGHSFYVANTDGLWRYPYIEGQTHISGQGKRIVILPTGGYNNHWTRNIRTDKDSSRIYISVGSGTNVGEQGPALEARRADILVVNLDGSDEHIYATGLRNPAGIDFQPGTGVLYASVNERDELGDELVPDYFTSVKQGGFYGWPYAYWGQHEDPRHKGERPDMVKNAITPDVSLGSHTASLGLKFYDGKAFPKEYINGAFIGQHGSWNSSKLVGYKVVFVPFTNNKPGKPQDFLTGFISDAAKKEVFGRPVGVAVAKDGSLLVADDAGNKIWRVSAGK